MVAAVLVLGGCGDGGEQEPQSGQEAPQRTETGPSTRGAKAPIPPGTSSADARQIEVLRETFPLPKADTRAGRQAIEAGKEACEAKTPLQVRERFYAAAVSELDSAQAAMVERLPTYEARADRDASYVAGQLAAFVYEKSLPAAQASYGFQGCVYELARGLEGRILGGGG